MSVNSSGGSAGPKEPQAPSKETSVYLQVGKDDALEEYDLSSAPSFYYQTYRAPPPERKEQEQPNIAEADKAKDVQKSEAIGQSQVVTMQPSNEQGVSQEYGQQTQAQEAAVATANVCEVLTAQKVSSPNASSEGPTTAPQLLCTAVPIVEVATAQEVSEPVKEEGDVTTAREISPPAERNAEIATAVKITTTPETPQRPPFVEAGERKPLQQIAMVKKDQKAVQSTPAGRGVERKGEPPKPLVTPTPPKKTSKRHRAEAATTPKTKDLKQAKAITPKKLQQTKPAATLPASPTVQKKTAQAITKPQVEKVVTPKRRGSLKCLSDPIVTPVSDEYPTEDLHGDWIAPAVIDAKPKLRRRDTYDKAAEASDKNIISNPILTPRTDEYPTPTDEVEKSMQLAPRQTATKEVPKESGTKSRPSAGTQTTSSMMKPKEQAMGSRVVTPPTTAKTSSNSKPSRQATAVTVQKKQGGQDLKKGPLKTRSKRRRN